MKMASQTGIH